MTQTDPVGVPVRHPLTHARLQVWIRLAPFFGEFILVHFLLVDQFKSWSNKHGLVNHVQQDGRHRQELIAKRIIEAFLRALQETVPKGDLDELLSTWKSGGAPDQKIASMCTALDPWLREVLPYSMPSAQMSEIIRILSMAVDLHARHWIDQHFDKEDQLQVTRDELRNWFERMFVQNPNQAREWRMGVAGSQLNWLRLDTPEEVKESEWPRREQKFRAYSDDIIRRLPATGDVMSHLEGFTVLTAGLPALFWEEPMVGGHLASTAAVLVAYLRRPNGC